MLVTIGKFTEPGVFASAETPRHHSASVPQDGRDQEAQLQQQQPFNQPEKVGAGYHCYRRRSRYRYGQRA